MGLAAGGGLWAWPVATQPALAQAPSPAPSDDGLLHLDAKAQETLKVAPLRRRTWSAQRELAGEVVIPPDARAVLSAPWPGRVVALPVQVGQKVQAGQPLVVLASAELGQAEAAFLKARGNLALAGREAQRMKRLLEAELASRREVEEAHLRAQAAQVELEASREALRAMGLDEAALAQLARGGRVVGRRALLAPISGVVVAREALLGAAVGPQDAQALVALAQLGTAWVSLAVPERDLGSLRVGAKASVSFVGLGGAGLEGRVTRLAPALDAHSRALSALVALPNPSGALRPGLSAQVRLALAPREVLLLPPGAVLREPGGSYAYQSLGEGRYRELSVTVGEESPEGVELLSGLREGDSVVVAGAFDLRALAKLSQGGQ